MRMTLARATGLVALAALVTLGGASAHRTAATDRTAATSVNWLDFGNTPNQNRYSPLTQITPDNVGQLGRAFTFDLNKIVPGIKKGQQSYPIVVDGTIFVTSGDDQVFAVNGTTGALIWHYAPDNVATFKNYGIVANRGVTYCDGKLFLLTLDMTIVVDRPGDREPDRRACAIGHAVPGAYANYGYSETSAPICANHTVVLGAAGSDYGVRGFVMAYHTDLTPAWANPFWIIPPAGTEWRSKASLVGGATNWTPETVDTDDEHAVLRHRGGVAGVLPVAAARARSARGLAGRGRPRDREAEVVAAAARLQRVGLRHLAAADGLHGEDRRQDDARRLGRDDGGHVVRLRRDDRRADLPAREGDRQRRAPGPRARGSRSPSIRRRSAASTTRRPPTIRRRTTSTTRRRRPAPRCSSRRRRRRRRSSCSSGTRSSGLANGDFGAVPPVAAGRTTARSARSTSNTGKVVWKFQTPAARARRRDDDGVRASASSAAATA